MRVVLPTFKYPNNIVLDVRGPSNDLPSSEETVDDDLSLSIMESLSIMDSFLDR